MNAVPHESAVHHVTGTAVYIDDMVVSDRQLCGLALTSPHPHARILHIDADAARRTPGVHAILTASDIPGHNQVGPVVSDEPCLAADEVTCIGQAVALVAAETMEQCRAAAAAIRVAYEPLPAILSFEDAMQARSLMGPCRTMRRGDPDRVLPGCPHRITGELRTGAQEHWYLESQAGLSVPGEGGEMMVYSSTQNPSETQTLVAEVLGVHRHDVTVEVRRMGGGFGGKETQANHIACWAALLARATQRPVGMRLFRDDDMIMTGKRHPYLIRYDAGFDDEGMILALVVELHSDGGNATDLSFAIMERSMLHADNAYFIPDMRVETTVWRTNHPSNTAFRGFGGPQAMAAVETVIDRIARTLAIDPVIIRKRNYYGIDDRNVTHYGQTVEHNRLHMIHDMLIASSELTARRRAVDAFNRAHEFRRRGLAMTPVKFGISFTTTFLNQAGALVHVYADGSILVNHGGTEMGQGLHTKIRQIAAAAFGVSVDTVRVNATNTARVPNTSATAASSGCDLNGMAVEDACDRIIARLRPVVADVLTEKHPDTPSLPDALTFCDGHIVDRDHPGRAIAFADAVHTAWRRQTSLSATGFYRTPDIAWDKVAGVGRPFHYFAFGMAVTEVEIDVLTGAHDVLRVDILHDVGESINEDIDRGQITGGFVQGLGWCTTEEIRWGDDGRLLTHSPDTYKIPTIGDIPRDFRVTLLPGVPNIGTIRRSKAVGEPPFMLALSAWLAIKDAVSSVGSHRCEPTFNLPATNEVIVLAAEEIRSLTNRSNGAM